MKLNNPDVSSLVKVKLKGKMASAKPSQTPLSVVTNVLLQDHDSNIKGSDGGHSASSLHQMSPEDQDQIYQRDLQEQCRWQRLRNHSSTVSHADFLYVPDFLETNYECW